MKKLSPWFIAVGIFLYTGWHASDLSYAWKSTPVERYSGILLFIWSFPIILYWLGALFFSFKRRPFPQFLLWGALITTLLGVIGKLNALQYLGFSLALAAFLPFSWATLPWIGCALSWMPALGWLGLHYFPTYIIPFRR